MGLLQLCHAMYDPRQAAPLRSLHVGTGLTWASVAPTRRVHADLSHDAGAAWSACPVTVALPHTSLYSTMNLALACALRRPTEMPTGLHTGSQQVSGGSAAGPPEGKRPLP